MTLSVKVDEVTEDRDRRAEGVRLSVLDGDQVIATLQVWRDGVRDENIQGSLEGVGLVEWDLPE